MKKKTPKYYDAHRSEIDGAIIFTCKCWICGSVNVVEYRVDTWGRFVYSPCGSEFCKHTPGWNHAEDLSWLKMAFKEPPRPRRRKAAK